MKYKQLAAQYTQEIEQLKQAHELEIKRMTEEIEALKRNVSTEGIKNSSEPEEMFPVTPPPDLTDTSLTLPEAIRKYHAPEESTDYSVTLWGGAHFEGVRECVNENCVNKGKKIPVGKMKFGTYGGSWYFFCSDKCEGEVYDLWNAKARPRQQASYEETAGYRVRQIRTSLGESQKQFAQRFNVHPVHISLWETNKAKPPKEVLEWPATPSRVSETEHPQESVANAQN